MYALETLKCMLLLLIWAVFFYPHRRLRDGTHNLDMCSDQELSRAYSLLMCGMMLQPLSHPSGNGWFEPIFTHSLYRFMVYCPCSKYFRNCYRTWNGARTIQPSIRVGQEATVRLFSLAPLLPYVQQMSFRGHTPLPCALRSCVLPGVPTFSLPPRPAPLSIWWVTVQFLNRSSLLLSIPSALGSSHPRHVHIRCLLENLLSLALHFGHMCTFPDFFFNHKVKRNEYIKEQIF